MMRLDIQLCTSEIGLVHKIMIYQRMVDPLEADVNPHEVMDHGGDGKTIAELATCSQGLKAIENFLAYRET